MKKKRPNKLVSWITAGLLMVNQLGITPELWAATPPEVKIPSSGFKLTLPPDLGTIQALHSGTGPTLIHIQTAHGNYEAQKKIQTILHYLKDTYGFKLLLLEGSASKLNPELLKFFPERMDLTMKMAEELTKVALVKGDELFLLEEPEAGAYGIEDIPTYRKTREAFKAVILQKEKTERFLQDMDMQIERLTGPYLNKNLRSFLKRLESFESKTLPLLDWFIYLKTQAKEVLTLDLADPMNQFDWPMLLRIFKLREFESKIDLNAFAKERDQFFTEIALSLREAKRRSNLHPGTASASSGTPPHNEFEEIKTLLSSPLSQNQLPDPETGLLFERMVEALPENFNYDKFPNVKLFIGHLILQSELKGERLIGETNRLTDQISHKLAKTEEEKKILKFLKDHRLLKRLFALELTPEDYDAITRARDQPRPSRTIQGFLELNKGKRVRNLEFSHLEAIDSLFDKALEFYRGVKERDGFMLQNIETRLKETGAEKAVIITGGFHAGPFRQFFETQGVNYALIAPKITTAEGREAYLQAVLQNSANSLTKSTMDLPRRMEPPAMQQLLGEDLIWIREKEREVRLRILREAKEPIREGPPTISARSPSTPRRAEVRGVRLQLEQLEDRTAPSISNLFYDTISSAPPSGTEDLRNLYDSTSLVSPIYPSASTLTSNQTNEFIDQEKIVPPWLIQGATGEFSYNSAATIYPSTTLTRADITLLPEYKVWFSPQNSLPSFTNLRQSQRASVILDFVWGDREGIVDRRAKISYATGPIPGWIGAGFTYIEPVFAAEQPGDLSHFSQLVFGLKGDPSEVVFEISDTQGKRAIVTLTGVRNDKKEVWAIPTSLFTGVNLSAVHSLTFYVVGAFKSGALEIDRWPLPLSIQGLQKEPYVYHVEGQPVLPESVSIRIEALAGSSVAVKPLGLSYIPWNSIDHRTLSPDAYPVAPAYYGLKDGIFTFTPPPLSNRLSESLYLGPRYPGPGEYRLVLEVTSNTPFGPVRQTETVSFYYVLPAGELNDFIGSTPNLFEDTRYLLDSLFGEGKVELPSPVSPLWRTTIAETLDSKLIRDFGAPITRKALKLTAPIIVDGKSAVIEIAINPVTHEIIDQIVWLRDGTGMGIVTRSELNLGLFGGLFFTDNRRRLLYGLVDGKPEVAIPFDSLERSETLSKGSAMWAELSRAEDEGRQPQLFLQTYGHTHRIEGIDIVATKDVPHSVWHLAVELFEEGLKKFDPEIIKRLAGKVRIIIAPTLEGIPEFNQLNILAQSGILGVFFNPYSPILEGKIGVRFIGDINENFQKLAGNLDTFLHTLFHEFFGHAFDTYGIRGDQRATLYDDAQRSSALYGGYASNRRAPAETLAEEVTAFLDAMRADNTPKYIQNWEQLIRINPETAGLLEKIFRFPSTVPLLPTLNPDRVKAEDIRRLLEIALNLAGLKATVRTIPGTVHDRENIEAETSAQFVISVSGFKEIIVSGVSRISYASQGGTEELGRELVISIGQAEVKIWRGWVRRNGEKNEPISWRWEITGDKSVDIFNIPNDELRAMTFGEMIRRASLLLLQPQLQPQPSTAKDLRSIVIVTMPEINRRMIIRFEPASQASFQFVPTSNLQETAALQPLIQQMWFLISGAAGSEVTRFDLLIGNPSEIVSLWSELIPRLRNVLSVQKGQILLQTARGPVQIQRVIDRTPEGHYRIRFRANEHEISFVIDVAGRLLRIDDEDVSGLNASEQLDRFRHKLIQFLNRLGLEVSIERGTLQKQNFREQVLMALTLMAGSLKEPKRRDESAEEKSVPRAEVRMNIYEADEGEILNALVESRIQTSPSKFRSLNQQKQLRRDLKNNAGAIYRLIQAYTIFNLEKLKAEVLTILRDSKWTDFFADRFSLPTNFPPLLQRDYALKSDLPHAQKAVHDTIEWLIAQNYPFPEVLRTYQKAVAKAELLSTHSSAWIPPFEKQYYGPSTKVRLHPQRIMQWLSINQELGSVDYFMEGFASAVIREAWGFQHHLRKTEEEFQRDQQLARHVLRDELARKIPVGVSWPPSPLLRDFFLPKAQNGHEEDIVRLVALQNITELYEESHELEGLLWAQGEGFYSPGKIPKAFKKTKLRNPELAKMLREPALNLLKTKENPLERTKNLLRSISPTLLLYFQGIKQLGFESDALFLIMEMSRWSKSNGQDGIPPKLFDTMQRGEQKAKEAGLFSLNELPSEWFAASARRLLAEIQSLEPQSPEFQSPRAEVRVTPPSPNVDLVRQIFKEFLQNLPAEVRPLLTVDNVFAILRQKYEGHPDTIRLKLTKEQIYNRFHHVRKQLTPEVKESFPESVTKLLPPGSIYAGFLKAQELGLTVHRKLHGKKLVQMAMHQILLVFPHAYVQLPVDYFRLAPQSDRVLLVDSRNHKNYLVFQIINGQIWIQHAQDNSAHPLKSMLKPNKMIFIQHDPSFRIFNTQIQRAKKAVLPREFEVNQNLYQISFANFEIVVRTSEPPSAVKTEIGRYQKDISSELILKSSTGKKILRMVARQSGAFYIDGVNLRFGPKPEQIQPLFVMHTEELASWNINLSRILHMIDTGELQRLARSIGAKVEVDRKRINLGAMKPPIYTRPEDGKRYWIKDYALGRALSLLGTPYALYASGSLLGEPPSSPRAEVREAKENVTREVPRSLSAKEGILVKILGGLFPLQMLTKYGRVFLTEALITLGFVQPSLPAEAVSIAHPAPLGSTLTGVQEPLNFTPERIAAAKRFLGIKADSQVQEAYLLGADLALNEGGLALIETLFKDSLVAIVVRNPEELKRLEEYNHTERITKGKSRVLVVKTLRRAERVLTQKLKGKGIVYGFASPREVSSEWIRILEQNFKIMNQVRLQSFAETFGILSLVEEFRARFQIERSA